MMMQRLLQALHGHLGILAAVALLHPALLLRAGKPLTRRNRWSVGLSTALTAAAFGTGLAIYGDYRELVKVPLFRANVRAGLLFETKEHLAVLVISLAVGAAVAAFAAPREAKSLRRMAALAYALAAALCLTTAGLGSYVTSVRGFWG